MPSKVRKEASPVSASTAQPAAAPTAPSKDAKPLGAREIRSAARREAILNAALEEFSSQGFAAARLDDVAKRAGVAKGTIYLYFADKEALFQELARSILSPLVGHLEGLAKVDVPFPVLARGLVDVMVREVLGTRRKDIIRLIISEGTRFPALAEFYHREVLSKVFTGLRIVLQRAVERGELRHRELVDFPQLLASPLLVAIVWNSVFGHLQPLDARAMLNAHIDILLGRDGGGS
ncbi:TetR/AcrR family transcriptional regulator [Pseudorhodoplanes sp.]|uniref:TetR/AcrR family transcriptional regulator n=1 Tax=Pseudorhodoplanes sp. TaxID=1934341 RepID=UPI002BE7DC0C|nr:TetR/AcrR family transcriptional regulator [Pseudorhodoplanes sp.]HWV51265.1 TetR/AcrR family transcriptional regulator [Pseudorhodoplanes sp.]